MAAQSLKPPSLTATLREFDDESLAELLRQRPDLAVPPPAQVAGLATRARTAMSVSRALDQLDEFTLLVLDGLRLVGSEDDGGPHTRVESLSAVTEDLSDVPGAIRRLRSLGLVWGPDNDLRYPATLAEVAGPYPAGLGRPAAELSPDAAAVVGDAATLRRTVLAASPQARSVLDTLAAGPPIGTVADAYAQAPADTPVRWLIAHHLLVPVAEDTVELPREVGVLLRRDFGPLGRLRREADLTAPLVRSVAAVDSAGAAQVCEVVRLTEALLEAMTDEPAAEVKSGGIGMHALHRLARAAEINDDTAGILLEMAYAAGLLGRDGEGWLPGHSYDSWRSSPISVRWTRLARAWLSVGRDARLLGARPSRSRPATVLSDALVSLSAPRYRAEALALLAACPNGTGMTIETAVEICGWRHPRRRADDAIRAALSQAAVLGITARDALTDFGRILLEPPDEDDPLGIRAPEVDPLLTALDDILPAPVDELVVQSDLTVIVPGHPSPLLTAELSLVTDKESATVHRVTEASLRRAMDAGYAADDVSGVFSRRSRGELPQALTYLITDVARRHGGLRVGSAGAYLRSEDTALLTQVLTNRRLADAALRRLAPTVLMSPLPVSALLTMLRQAGHTPVSEDATGAIVIDRVVENRAPQTIRPEQVADPTPRVDGAPLWALVDQLRAEPEPSARQPRAEPADDDDATEILREAVPERTLVWVEYVDGRGDTVRRLLRPVSMGAGFLRAEDKRTEMLHTIALHAIRSATVATP